MVKFMEGFVLRRADAIAVPDSFGVNYLSSLHGISEDKFTILPNFVDIEQFVPGDVGNRSKKQFLFVGRLESDQKRPALAIGAVASVPSARLDIVGEGPELDRIKTITSDMENVRLLGRLPHAEIAELMSSALGFVIPSRYEGNPKVVIEALSAGLPVIATSAQGLNEIVRDGVNGLLVDADAESIANAMQRLMDDPELWLKLSQGGRQTAIDNYSRTSVMDREISLLTRLIDG